MAPNPRPAIQGDLDGLCGVYSIVNSIQWALHTCTATAWEIGQARKRLSWAEREALFDTLVTALGSDPARGPRSGADRRLPHGEARDQAEPAVLAPVQPRPRTARCDARGADGRNRQFA